MHITSKQNVFVAPQLGFSLAKFITNVALNFVQNGQQGVLGHSAIPLAFSVLI